MQVHIVQKSDLIYLLPSNLLERFSKQRQLQNGYVWGSHDHGQGQGPAVQQSVGGVLNGKVKKSTFSTVGQFSSDKVQEFHGIDVTYR